MFKCQCFRPLVLQTDITGCESVPLFPGCICVQIVSSDNRLHGVWYASSDVASTTICWFKVDGGRLMDVNVAVW